MWKFIVDVVHNFVSSLQPDVGRGFVHVSNVFLLSSQVAPWVVIMTTYGAASDGMCFFLFHKTVSPALWGARRVLAYICINMCGDIHFMYVWAGQHLYIVLVELGDIKCMMTSPNGNIFRVAGPLWGESTGHRWIPHTHANDMKLWYFLWSVPQQIIKMPVIWGTIILNKTSLWVCWFCADSFDCTTGHPLTPGPTHDCPCVCGGAGEMSVKSTSTKVK